MLPDGPVLIVLVLVALGYYAVDQVKAPIKKTAHAICHVVTLGHKCDAPPPLPVVLPAPAPADPCPPRMVFMETARLRACIARSALRLANEENDAPQPER